MTEALYYSVLSIQATDNMRNLSGRGIDILCSNFNRIILFPRFELFDMATTEKESNQSLKRPAEEESTDVSAKKKAKTNTIPIVRGKFKGRWLAKHATLLKRSDSACGVLVSSNIHSETRALVNGRYHGTEDTKGR